MNKSRWNLKRWKMGLLVSIITGLATAFAVGVIVPSMTMKAGVLVCLGSIAKDLILFLNQHPVESIELDEPQKDHE